MAAQKNAKSKSGTIKVLLFSLGLVALALFLYRNFRPDPAKVPFPVYEDGQLAKISDAWFQREGTAIASYDDQGQRLTSWETDLNHPMVCFGDRIYVASSKGKLTAYNSQGKPVQVLEADIPFNAIQFFDDRVYALGGTGIFVYDQNLKALEDYDTEARVAFVTPLEQGFAAVEVGTRGVELRSSFTIYDGGQAVFRMTHFNEVVQYVGSLGQDRIFYVTDRAIYLYRDLVLDASLEIPTPSAIAHTDQTIAIISGNVLRIYDTELRVQETVLKQAYESMVGLDQKFYFSGPEGYGSLIRGKLREVHALGVQDLKEIDGAPYLIFEDGVQRFPRRNPK